MEGHERQKAYRDKGHPSMRKDIHRTVIRKGEL